MGKVTQDSSWNLPPTAKQIKAISDLCMQLGEKEYLEDKPSNRYEARRLLFELRKKREVRNRSRKGGGVLR